MKVNRKKTQKRNLFDEEDDQNEQQKVAVEQVSPQKPKSQTMIDRVNQIYNPAKIQQNEHYIGRKVNQEELKGGQNKLMDKNKPKKKKMMNNKKKNLFDDDSEEDKKQIQQENQEDEDIKQQQNQEQQKKPKVNKYVSNKESVSSKKVQTPNLEQKTKKIQSDLHIQKSEEQEEQEDQQKQDHKRQQKVKQMVQQQQKNEEDDQRQISFSKLIEKAGPDKQKIKRLVYEPIPKGFRAICLFKRIPNGFSQSYQLLLEDDERALFFCENQRGSIGANYYISLTKQMDKKSVSYVGKLRGNSTGSIYQLYDCGKQPEKNINRRQWRISMAKIQYQNNFMGMNGPRKLKVIVPRAQTLQDFDSFKLAEDEQLSTFQPPIVTKYRNKQPRWNQRLKSYALNFGGRVKQASIKNFILVDDSVAPQEEFGSTNSLVFGKIDDHTFSLEAVYPLSLYQAFGIIMSQFDFKLNCQ